MSLDHIVIAGPDLAELIDWFAERTSVTATPGGRHPRGTANALVALTTAGARMSTYLELIGPDPDSAVTPETFGIADLPEPSIVTYAVRPADLDRTVAEARRRGYDPGDVTDLSRRTPDGTELRWRLSRTDSVSDRLGGVPFPDRLGRHCASRPLRHPHPRSARLAAIRARPRAHSSGRRRARARPSFARPTSSRRPGPLLPHPASR